MDIDGWLRRIGLEQYAQAFRDNAIDADVLRDLTDDHLREIGLSLGARLKLLRALAALDTSEQTARFSGNHTCRPHRRRAPPAHGHVLRSRRLDRAFGARLDPEDMREIVGAYHRPSVEVVTKAGGFVAKYVGDGVLAYFGYPQAHKHDAERAVLTGLALVEAVPKPRAAAATPLYVRVGIATELEDLGPRARASPGRRGRGLRCARVPWQAALTPCTRPA